jgi:hypothetical protein
MSGNEWLLERLQGLYTTAGINMSTRKAVLGNKISGLSQFSGNGYGKRIILREQNETYYRSII